MQAKIITPDLSKEVLTEERCHILECWNSDEDPSMSIARARVKPGVTTALHALTDVQERYVILSGTACVEVGDLQATNVGAGDVVLIPESTPQCITNTGVIDLLFLAICTPRFTKECYKNLET